MRIVKAGLIYFAIVFGAGFILGPIRILWLVPRVGTRFAELMEMPIMLMVIILAARWVVLRYAVPVEASKRIGMGCIALASLLILEFTFVIRLRGMTISDYFATLDPVSGTAFFVMQAAMVLMPMLIKKGA